MMKPATEVGVVGVRKILLAANVKNVRMDITVPMISVKVIEYIYQIRIQIILIGITNTLFLDCKCNEEGRKNKTCDINGKCICKDGYYGKKCESSMRE